MPSTDDPFAAIAQEAIEKAERVDCDLTTFYRGLLSMIGVLKNRVDDAQDEGVSREDLEG